MNRLFGYVLRFLRDDAVEIVRLGPFSACLIMIVCGTVLLLDGHTFWGVLAVIVGVLGVYPALFWRAWINSRVDNRRERRF